MRIWVHRSPNLDHWSTVEKQRDMFDAHQRKITELELLTDLESLSKGSDNESDVVWFTLAQLGISSKRSMWPEYILLECLTQCGCTTSDVKNKQGVRSYSFTLIA